MENPFYITGVIPEPFFCDRSKETDWVLKTLVNRAHILMTSPRRMGKTQLIYHVYDQPRIKDSYYTFYTDIFPTTSLHELILFLGKEIYSRLVPRGRSALDAFLVCLKSISGSFNYNPATGIPSFDLKLGDIHSPELTLQEIFTYLENADKPCIFAIDEFQQIARYPEKNVEAVLRSYIQKMNNCLFIYAGSERHILENMFNSPAKPFYNSAAQMHLDRIPKEIYVKFAIEKFREGGRDVLPEAVELAYDMFDGHTYYVHNLLHDAYAYLPEEVTVDADGVRLTLDGILERREVSFSTTLNQLNFQQKETLVAIAKEGKARRVSSVSFIKKHSLKSPSSVQYALTVLLDRQLVTYQIEERSKVYGVSDLFFEKWIQKHY